MDELMSDAVAAGARRSPAGDLSREIESAVERQPLDRVRCVRVFDDYYRCNWWSPLSPQDASRQPLAEWARLAMHRVRKSRFLRATSHAGELMIESAGPDARE
ncbi:MAG TPA: hypothetical protein VH475_02915 [Tepidisphaeraceae bacterium]